MTVFANGLEVSAKAQGVKAVAVFPDVCMTPPQAPPTPPGVPIPYPNFGFDSDLTSGTGTVKIGGKEVSQENSSKYSKCAGDEAGAAPKKGVITSKNMGKVHAQMWSMNVKAEGKGVARFSDIATSNHGSGGNTPPFPEVGKPGLPGYADNPNCLVGQYEAIKDKCGDRGGQAHHIIPDEYVRSNQVPTDYVKEHGITFSASDAKSKRKRMEKIEAHAKANGNPNPTRISEDLPGTSEGCCVCVGGNASGSTARESKPTSDKGKKAQDSIIKKGEAHAEKGGTDLSGKRGHGFLHKFDEDFRDMSPPSIDNALECANKLLDECVVYEGSALDSDCAEVAKECIKEQYSSAKDNGTQLKSMKSRSQNSRDKRAKKLAKVP